MESETTNRLMRENTQLAYENNNLKAENERLTDMLDQIKHWCMAYPITVFIEPDWKAVHETLEEAGLNLAAVSGSNMRHVVTGIQRIIDRGESRE
jgi:hypothetical protein